MGLTLLVLHGPAAVGKMTVGQALCARTGYKLYHNHMSFDPVLPVFDIGVGPFWDLVFEFRFRMIEEAAKMPLPGLVHTYMWAFDNEHNCRYMDKIRGMVLSHGGRTLFVELQAPWSARSERAISENRAKHKPRNVALGVDHILTIETGHRYTSDGHFPYPDEHLVIDNSTLSPDEAAQRICEHFGLSQV